MPRTPDRFAGKRFEEAIILSGSEFPITGGEFTYLTGVFVQTDSLGAFDPRPRLLFDAIVAPSGTVSAESGSYFTSPSEAFNAGAKCVFVRSGTYIETTDVVIPDGGHLVGERPGVMIGLSGSASVTVDGNGGTFETAGTISFTNGSAAVVGVGTTFTNLSPGDWIGIGAVFYEIASITDALNLTLVNAYEGRSRTGFPMLGTPMFHNVSIHNIHISGSTGTGLLIRGVRDSHFMDVDVSECADNILINSSGDITLSACLFHNGTNDGADVSAVRTIIFESCHFYNNGGNGAQVSSGFAVKFNGCESDNNGVAGYDVTGNATDVTLSGCGSKNNAGKGINTDTGTVRVVVDSCTVEFNGGDGIDFDGSENIISNSQIGNGLSVGVRLGDAGVISDCHIHDNASDGLSLAGDDNCAIVGNIINDNGGDGIDIIAGNDNIVIASNRIFDNAGDGIDLAAGATGIKLVGNLITGHTSDIANDETTTIYGVETTGDAVHGDILYRSSSAADGVPWTRLPAGAAGQFLQTQGPGADPIWATAAGSGNVTASDAITDNSVVRGDGGANGIQDSAWFIRDDGQLFTSGTTSDYLAKIMGPGAGGNGVWIMATENEGDIIFKLSDADDSLEIMEIHGDDGQVVMGATYADVLAEHGTVYGIDLHRDFGDTTDINTQFGGYRVSGSLIIDNDGNIDTEAGGLEGTINGYYHYPAGTTDPTSPTPSDGDRYYNTSLDMEMRYDGARAKWFSVESMDLQFGRSGSTAAGSFYRLINGMAMTTTRGMDTHFSGTIVSFSYTRSDTDNATFEVLSDGIQIYTLNSTQVSDEDTAADADFGPGEVLSVRNLTGLNTTSNVQGWLRVKWRI